LVAIIFMVLFKFYHFGAITFVGLAIGLPASWFVERFSKSKYFIKYNNSAIEFIKNDDLKNAIIQFELALSLKPNNPAIHYNLAWLYSATENTKQALEHLYFAYKFKLVGLKEKIETNENFEFIKKQSDFSELIKYMNL
jgi:tetratricopeptide (TPR) repeat protein